MSELRRDIIQIRASLSSRTRSQGEEFDFLDLSAGEQQNAQYTAFLSSVRRRRSNGRQNQSIAVNVHPFIVMTISGCIKMLESILNQFIDFFVAAHVSTDTVHQVSILLTSIYLLQPYLPFSNVTIIQHQIIWLLPIFTSIASFSFFLALLVQWHPHQVVIATGLVSILIIECLVPLAITSCTALFVIQFWTWESAMIILMLVWV